jgi:predicted nucleic acid-binding protein
MNDKVFFDTNVLIYLYSLDEPGKRNRALNLVNSVQNPIISTQVINEFNNILLKKFTLSASEIFVAIDEIENVFTIHPFTLSMQKEALKIKERFGFQYYDSLILATALAYECSILYSEDMQNGQKIKTLQIINPFS